jgi:hypothetical protein
MAFAQKGLPVLLIASSFLASTELRRRLPECRERGD